jgi:hypothetical protein
MKKMAYLGIILLCIGFLGYGYTYLADRHTANSLSAYCRIDFQSSIDEKGNIEGATFSLTDHRYANAKQKPVITIITDGNDWDVDAVTKQTPPTYSLAAYNPDTSFKNTDKFFIEVPFWLLPEIASAQEVRVRFGYEDGVHVDLPLDAHDLAYWHEQLKSH